MIEVHEESPGRFVWTWICSQGRILMQSRDTFLRDVDAFKDAATFRSTFWKTTAQIDAY